MDQWEGWKNSGNSGTISSLACPENPKQFTICDIPDTKQWFQCHDLITENGIPQNGDLQILARITDNNSTFLKGNTINNPENAMAISTLPVDITLWHRQFGHHHSTGINQAIMRTLRTGITLKSQKPQGKPCLAGKMHANPFSV